MFSKLRHPLRKRKSKSSRKSENDEFQPTVQRNLRDLSISDPQPHPLSEIPDFEKSPRPSQRTGYTSESQSSNEYSEPPTAVTSPDPDWAELKEDPRFTLSPRDHSFSPQDTRRPLARTNDFFRDAGVQTEKWQLNNLLASKDSSHSTLRLHNSSPRTRRRRDSVKTTSARSLSPIPSHDEIPFPRLNELSELSDTMSELDISGNSSGSAPKLAVLRWLKDPANETRQQLFAEVQSNSRIDLVPVIYPPADNPPFDLDQAHMIEADDAYQVARTITNTGARHFEVPPVSTFPIGEDLELYKKEIMFLTDRELAITGPHPAEPLGLVPHDFRRTPIVNNAPGTWKVTQQNELPISPDRVWMTGCVLGSGTFGRVLRVLHVPARKDLAMKVVYVKRPLPKIACIGLVNEIKVLTALAQIGHARAPFVMIPSLELDKFAWWDPTEGFLHMLYPFCPGGELWEYRGCLSPDELRMVAAELVLALRFLHIHGIVHSDLKPENIFVDTEGHLVLSDFGGAKFLTNGVLTRKTHEDVVCSLPYAAPELVFDGPEEETVYDEKIDWWSLGVVITVMTTGELLFYGNTADVQRQQNDLSNHLPKALPPHETAEDLRDFVQKLLTFEASDRITDDSVQEHPYFDSFRDSWDLILDRRMPAPIRYVRHAGGQARGYDVPVKESWDESDAQSGLFFISVLRGEGFQIPESSEYDVGMQLRMLTSA
ncbi:unnamed protein product [Somion occarium]|uniref:Protein kinase domain-containing protein n=1 Tax=Somion occarium TaxID=3059160 RepID=A0ABP1DQ18_9APHY